MSLTLSGNLHRPTRLSPTRGGCGFLHTECPWRQSPVPSRWRGKCGNRAYALTGMKANIWNKTQPFKNTLSSISLPQFYSLSHVTWKTITSLYYLWKWPKRHFLRQWVLENNCSPRAPQLSLWWTVFVTEAETLLFLLRFVWTVSKEKEREYLLTA